jgi:hypothetical protein
MKIFIGAAAQPVGVTDEDRVVQTELSGAGHPRLELPADPRRRRPGLDVRGRVDDDVPLALGPGACPVVLAFHPVRVVGLA